MGKVIDNPLLRERKYVFTDRHEAGKLLAALVQTTGGIRCDRVLAIPAGGVPVGRELAQALNAPLSLAIVRKIRIPGNTEAGFGAVTWDGRVRINETLVRALGLTAAEIRAATAETQQNVRDRIARFMSGKAFPDLQGEHVIITDDGLASGFTMLATLESVWSFKPGTVIVAVPTAPSSTAALVAGSADLVVCANIRSSGRFAVADAYREWYDLDDEEVVRELDFGREEERDPPRNG